MKKPFQGKKLSRPTKILRRVLSKTAKIELDSEETSASCSMDMPKVSNYNSNEDKVQERQIYLKPTINVEAELLLLKEQISNLQNAVNSMQNETERKEVAIANLAREKERLACDLKKQQRTNNTLKQQLEDEREFYFKEKELYCQEMNDCKKLKKSLKHGDHKSQLEYYKKEASKLKESLTQTLEANYNLSVKFLRMKNTKYCIKNRLKKLEVIHESAVKHFETQLDSLRSELTDVVDKELQIPIPPSNKKYLQLVKHNGILTHDNLCLRLELDRLSLEVERLKMLEVRNHTNNKLKYINHNNRRETDRKNPSGGNSHNSTNKHAQNKEEQLIYFTNEDENNQRNNMKRESEMCIRKIFEEEIKCGLPGVTMTSESTRICPKVPDDGNPSNFDLIQLHENPSDTLTNDSEFTQCYNAVRTQSAPEIVQTSLFVNST